MIQGFYMFATLDINIYPETAMLGNTVLDGKGMEGERTPLASGVEDLDQKPSVKLLERTCETVGDAIFTIVRILAGAEALKVKIMFLPGRWFLSEIGFWDLGIAGIIGKGVSVAGGAGLLFCATEGDVIGDPAAPAGGETSRWCFCSEARGGEFKALRLIAGNKAPTRPLPILTFLASTSIEGLKPDSTKIMLIVVGEVGFGRTIGIIFFS